MAYRSSVRVSVPVSITAHWLECSLAMSLLADTYTYSAVTMNTVGTVIGGKMQINNNTYGNTTIQNTKNAVSLTVIDVSLTVRTWVRIWLSIF